MSRKLSCVLLALLTLTVVASAHTAYAQGAKPPAPVVVTNTPLPVLVSNPVTSVAITGTPSVTVTNPVTAVTVSGIVATKNIDEAGRTPWNTRSQIIGSCYGESDCYNYEGGDTWATFDLPPIPAGKRWIVKSASAGFTSARDVEINVTLHNNRGSIYLDGLKWAFAGPFFPGVSFNAKLFTGDLFVTFDPGETPTVRMTAKPNLPGYSVIVFNGYLIDEF